MSPEHDDRRVELDASTFDDLCRRLYPRLVAALTLHTGDREASRDLAQEALCRAWRDWDRVRHADAPDAWVFRTAWNLESSWLRRLRTARRAAPVLAVVEPVDDGDPAMRVLVRDALASLPRRQRTAVIARHYLDLSVAETATAMGCAEGTVRALTAQGVARLRTTLGHDFGEEDE